MNDYEESYKEEFYITPTQEELEIEEKSWYRFNSVNDTYYTPFIGKKTKYYVADEKNPNNAPTAGQIVDKLNKGFHLINQGTGKVYFQKTVNKASKTAMKLPAGVYIYKSSPYRVEFLVPLSVRDDDHVIKLSNGVSRVEEMLDNFLKKESLYNKCNLTYRMGILAYGPPGNGKTISVRKLLNAVVEKIDGVAIFIDSFIPSSQFLEVIKKSCDNRIKVFIFEEFTEFLKNPFQKRDAVLNFLDGELSMSKSITIATTNFPEKIPGNIKNRPGRFDQQICFSNPEKNDRQRLFTGILGRKATEEELLNSMGLSVAAIKECCIDVLIRDKKLLDSVLEMKQRIKESREFNKKKEIKINHEELVSSKE